MEIKVLHKQEKSSYQIRFTDNFNNLISKNTNKYEKIAIVTDTNIYKLYRRYLANKNVLVIKINPGEKSKSNKTKMHIEELLFKYHFNRKSLLVAIGGGVVGDLAAFVASTYMRGIDLIHVPTSLIAIVDSSIGGKTGINNKLGKNLVGTFYNPREIIINKKFLKTLPQKEVTQGLAEIIKYGIISNKSLFLLLEKGNKDFLKNPEKVVNSIIKRCIMIKVKTVEDDFKESNKRVILNFGHTIGHALEKHFSYKKSHGECIGLGMLIESKISYSVKKLSKNDYSRIKNVLDKFNLLNLKIHKTDISKLIRHMKLDKKNKSSKITFSLPNKIGSMSKQKGIYSMEIPERTIISAIKEVLDEFKNK
jgi:3-dehydroquinate synthase